MKRVDGTEVEVDVTATNDPAQVLELLRLAEKSPRVAEGSGEE